MVANALRSLRRDVEACRQCELWERATQGVTGEGPVQARIALVGEQPGDQEDRAGRPFVGPAGRMLDRALAAAGIDRETVFVTNIVKHFRWRPSPDGKRRLHDRPNARQVRACRPWLQEELALVQPEVTVLMGATAAEGVLGSDVQVTRDRGRAMTSESGSTVLVTVHPSAILRVRDRAEREAAFQALVADLSLARRLLETADRLAHPSPRSTGGSVRRRGRPRSAASR